MPMCKQCGEDVEELQMVKVGGKSRKVCEDCAAMLEEEGAVAESANEAMRGMMEYKGK